MTAAPTHSDVCVITGAAGGLGLAIARRLLRDGYRVALTDRALVAAEEAAASLSGETAAGAGDRLAAFALDVSEKAAFEAALESVKARWGGVGALVNNAALTQTSPLFDITPDEFDRVIDVNMRGVFLGCQVFGAAFAEQGYGRIVNLASLAGQNGGSATGAHYAASKGGIVTLTKVFARDLAARGVTVNAISPGPLDVPLVRELLPPEKLEAVVASIPVGALGDPDFIGQVISLALSPAARSMTGATLDVNGGLYLR